MLTKAVACALPTFLLLFPCHYNKNSVQLHSYDNALTEGTTMTEEEMKNAANKEEQAKKRAAGELYNPGVFADV